MRQQIELRCSRDLALRLGAIGPETIAHHKALRDAAHLMIRDKVTSWPMFWPWVQESATVLKSSE